MGADLYSVSGTLFSHERYSIFEAMQNEPLRPVLVHKLSLYYSDNKKSMDHCLIRVREWAQWHVVTMGKPDSTRADPAPPH